MFYLRGVSTKQEFWAALRVMDGVAFDMESVETSDGDTVIGLGAGDDVIHGYATGDSSIIELLNRFETFQGPRIAHSAQADLRALGGVDVPAFYPVFDTIIAAHLVGEPLGYLGLKSLARWKLDIKIDDYGDMLTRHGAKDLGGIPERAVANYNLAQVRATYKLWKHYSAILDKDPVLKELFDLEMKILPILARMEEAGIMVDRPRLTKLGRRLHAEAVALQASVAELTDGWIQNVNSPRQVRDYIYGKAEGQLAIKPHYFTKGTKMGRKSEDDTLEVKAKTPSTDERALKRILREEENVGWLKILLRSRQLQKNVGTYCVGIVETLDEAWRSHSHLSQITTDTGRLASKDPNHQNIPKRRPEGLEVRRCMIAPEGYVLMACDMDQLELRILAEEANEPIMKDAFLKGEDIHTRSAIELFGDAKKRQAAKILNYTIVYLAGAEQIGDQIGESKGKAQLKQDKYFRVYSRLVEWMKEYDAICKARGWTETWLGRKRDIAAFYVTKYPLKKGEWITEGTRKAISTHIQGTAAEILKLAMLKIDSRLREEKLESRMLMQIHDEILMEVPIHEISQVSTLLKECMETTYKTMPLPATVKVGPNWADLK